MQQCQQKRNILDGSQSQVSMLGFCMDICKSVYYIVDNCRAAQNVTLSLPTIFNEILSTGIANPQYQFRIELSPANPCHCLNVDNATGVTGNNIFSGWRNGRLWCSNNITQLCASDSDNVTFYSALIRQNGLLSDMAVPLCDNSTDETLGIQPNVSVMQSCSSEETSTFLIPGTSHPLQ